MCLIMQIHAYMGKKKRTKYFFFLCIFNIMSACGNVSINYFYCKTTKLTKFENIFSLQQPVI